MFALTTRYVKGVESMYPAFGDSRAVPRRAAEHPLVGMRANVVNGQGVLWDKLPTRACCSLRYRLIWVQGRLVVMQSDDNISSSSTVEIIWRRENKE
jgi:hypothetical protein